MPSRKRTWFLVRMTLYLVVIGILLNTRGGISWQKLTSIFKPSSPSSPSLTVTGLDLAPDLVNRLLTAYRRDYPHLSITVKGGRTNQALEDLINRQADAAFLYRRPSAVEQRLFRQMTGDTAIVAPVAVGAILLAASVRDTTEGLTPDDLRAALAGRGRGPARFYVPDPNDGLWDGLGQTLGLDSIPGADPSPVVFLADQTAVLAAVEAEAAARHDDAWGLLSSLVLSPDSDPVPAAGLRFLTARAAPDSSVADPTYNNVATGRYPFHHVLYVACLATDDVEGGRFLTHLASGRGLRQVERTGTIPARRVSREIHLSRKPLGD